MVTEIGQKRRRSSIIPEILNGEPSGVGDLRIGARFMPKGKEHQLMSWDYLQKVSMQIYSFQFVYDIHLFHVLLYLGGNS